MMRVLDVRSVALTDITYDRQQVAALISQSPDYAAARSAFRRLVLDQDGRFCAGIWHLARAVAMQEPSLLCCMVECSAEEREGLGAAERLGERSTTGAAAHAVVELLMASVPEDGRREAGPGGVARSRRGDARRAAAAIMGRPHKMIAKYDRAAEASPAEKWTPETFGLPAPQTALETMDDLRRHLDRAVHRLEEASKAVAHLSARYPRFTDWEAIRDELRATRARLVNRLPVGLCPFCKHWGWLKDYCGSCGKTGVGSVAAYEAAPEVLLEPNRFLGYHGNRFVELKDIPQEKE